MRLPVGRGMLDPLLLHHGRRALGLGTSQQRGAPGICREAREQRLAISPRYIQDKISNALVAHPDEDNINPFMVLKELDEGLRHHALITSEDQLRHFKELLAVVKEEYEDIVKNEVQRAIAADEDALARLCGNYIDNVRAYTQREKVRNK